MTTPSDNNTTTSSAAAQSGNGSAPESVSLSGLWLAFGSYVLWGIFPLYFFWLRSVSAPEVLSHRVIWSALMLILIDAIWRPKVRWFRLIQNRRLLLSCLVTAVFLSLNWLLYIWAISNGMALEGSLGYYINPLISVLLATVFLKERLDRPQMIALTLASIGVGYLIWKTGTFPWVAIGLALLFGGYGLLRKLNAIDAFAGLTIETVLVLPFALIYLLWLQSQGAMAFLSSGWQIDVGLLMAGAVTTAPLILFLLSLPKLNLVTIGLLQYIAPTLQFFVAIYWLDEPFDVDRFISFVFIWTGLVVFSGSQINKFRKQRSEQRKQRRAMI